MPKNIHLSLFFFLSVLLFKSTTFGQVSGIGGNTCLQATPFCTSPSSQSVTFDNSTNTTSQSGPSYGCLGSQPNPAWFYIKTSGAGKMIFDLSQVDNFGTGIDVDFICWGPFTSYSTMCDGLTGNCAGDHNCWGNIVDCSYNPAAVETMTINSPGAGNYYVILITNYSNQPGKITFTQSSGPLLDCSINCPTVLGGDGFLQVLSNGSMQTLPSTINCNNGNINLAASNNASFGQPISPALLLSFIAKSNTSYNANLYENGTFKYCFGTPTSGCTYNTLVSGQSNDFQMAYLNPTLPYRIELCENSQFTSSFNYYVRDPHNNSLINSGSWVDDGVCQTINIPANTISGIPKFTATCGTCITDYGNGTATFNPSAAGVGSHTITYTYTPGGTCPIYTFSKIITITNPYVANWTSPGSFCINASSVNLNSYLSVGSTTGGTWSGPGVSGGIFNPATAGAGTHNITYSLGSGSCSASQIKTITVYALPNPTVGNGGPYCAGQTIALTANNGSSYSWTGPASFSSSAQNPTRPSATTAMAGTYTVVVTGTGGCSATATTSVTVNALPSPGATNTGPFCVGATISLSATGGGTYSWSGPNSFSSSSQNPSIANATTAMAGTYTVTVTNASSCSATASTVVVVNNKPTATITGSNSICSGASTVLSASTSTAGSGSISNYQWQLNGTNIPGASGITATTYTASAAGVYNVIVSNNNGCSTTSNNFTLTVNALPNPVIVGNTSFCAGSNVALNSTGSAPGSGSILNYQWQLNGTNISAPLGTAASYTATTAGTYNLIITNSNNCSKTSANHLVTVNAVPIVSIGGPTVFCSGTSFTLNSTGSSAGSGGIQTYQWLLNGTTISGANSDTYTGSVPGNYQLTIQNTNGCSTTSAVYAVSMHQSPTATITGTPTTCSNATTILYATTSIPGSGTITTYQWQLNGSNIAGANANQYTTNIAGNYQVVVSNTNSCSTTSAVTTLTVLQAPVINAGSVVINPSDCGASTGSITGITATGSGTLTYTWSNSVPAIVGSTANLTNQPAGTYNLLVSSSNGCSSASGPYTISNPTAPPSPTALANSAAPLTVCAGASVTLTASTIAGATYTWTGPNGFNASTQNPGALTNVSAANAGVYSVTATISGCTGPAGSVTVVVNAIPTAVVTGNKSFCQGQNSVLSAAASSPGSGTLSNYQWQLNGTNISGATAADYTVTTAGNYNVIVTNSNTCSNTSTTVVVTVFANPIAAITGNLSFCSGTSTVLSASGSNPGSGIISTYQWQLGGANIPGATLVNYTATNPGNYSVIVTNSNGCSSTSTMSTVSINQNPAVVVSGPNAFCAGFNTTLLTAGSTPGSGTISTYQWYLNGTALSGAISDQYTTNLPGNYSVQITNSNNCATTSANYVVSVNANPVANITGNNSFCDKANTILSAATSSSGSGIINGFQWLLNGVNIPGALGSTYTATAAGNYSVIVSNTNTCSNTSAVFAVTINANPQAQLNGATEICRGNSSLLNTTGTFAGSGTISSYQWLLNGATLTSGNNPSFSASVTGVYDVIVKNSNGCSDTATLNLTVYDNPSALITATPSIVCSNSWSVMDASNSNAGSGTIASYQWLLNNTVISGAASITYTTVTAGVYAVIVTNSHGCKDTSKITITLTVNQAPVAVVSGLTAFCSGLNTTLNAATSTAGSSPISSYQWLLNGAPLVSATNISYTANQPGAYQVITINGDNCIDTSTVFVLTQNALPLINGNTIMLASACNAATGALTGLTLSGAAPLSCVWTNATNTVVSTAINNAALINQPAGIYLLTVTDANGCIAKYGTDTIENIGAPPAPGYTQPNPYCQGDLISALTAIGTGSGTLSWYSDPNLSILIGTGTPFNPTINPTTTGTLTYYVTETISGCQGLASILTITINPTPPAPVASSPAPVCTGDPAPVLTATGSGGTIIWYANSSLTNPIGNGSPFTPNITTTSTIWLTEHLGVCRGPSHAVTVTFKPLPPAPVAVSPLPYCYGDLILPLNATGTGGTLNWYDNNNLQNAIGTGTTYTSGVTTTDTFYVAETLNNCKGSATRVIITVNPLPVLSGSAAFTPVYCGGYNGGITGFTVSNGTPPYTYSWTDSSGNIAGNTLNLSNATLGVYSLTITDANNCKTNSPALTLGGSGSVKAGLMPNISTGLSPLSVNFTNTSTGADGFTWSFGDLSPDSIIPNGITFPAMHHIFQQGGIYTVYLIAKNGNCNDTAKVIILVDQSSGITIIPNVFTPNNDGMNDVFEIKSEGLKTLDMTIFNRWGDLITHLDSPGQTWNGKLSNGEMTNDGTYFYILKAVGFDGKKYEVKGSLLIMR